MPNAARTLLTISVVQFCILLQGVGSPASAQDNELCLMCHADASIFEGLENAERLVVTDEQLNESIHGVLGMTCVDCHQDLMGFEDFPHAEELEPVDCSMCHSDVGEVYTSSLHGYALSRGNERAPTCSSCHGLHQIFPSSDPRSSTHKVRLPSTCATCHGTAGLLTDLIVKLPQSFTDYAQSVHGQGTERGVAAAASCADCHSVHDLRGAADPKSKINLRNIASTCGQCHPDIQLEYNESIHGRALQAGITDSPTCIDCHGEHLILSPRDKEAKTYAGKLATETCGQCHDDPVIIAKYNMQGGVVGSYVDSYHGWAARRNYESAATCVSCHTAHSVLPEEDPASAIHPDNVVQTCQQCHAEASLRFSQSYTHEAASITANPINRTIRNIYIVLITLIIVGMVIHNLVIINYFLIEKRKETGNSSWVMRFDLVQIIQHLALIISFAVLVITGLALRFPDAWWVVYLSKLGMTEPVRANLHRVFAAVLILTSFSHIYYLFFTKRGKKEFLAIIPRWRDITDLVKNIRFHTWRSREEVKFGRYDYTQKAEYWALIWGTILMIVTGLILWFPEATVKILPTWIVTASQTVHYYEAWLATLAILVWHFFFVIFHPEEYPMNWTWLTGKMSKRSVKKHHALWYEEEVEPGSESSGPDTDTESAGERDI